MDDWAPGPGTSLSPVTRIPSSLWGFRAGSWCQAGHVHDGNTREEVKIEGDYLLVAEAVGPHLITAWSRFTFGFFVELVAKRSGRVLRSLRVCPPNGVDWGNESLYRRRTWAIQTAEAAVLALKERRAGRSSKKSEAWLRRQLEGLGKGDSPRE